MCYNGFILTGNTGTGGGGLTDWQKVVLIALGVLLALGLIVGGVLNHHIGGFIETVAREEEEAREREEASGQSDDTGE